MTEPKTTYSRLKQLRARYGGVSEMWIKRRLHDAAFPKPIFFGSKERFWDNGELEVWDRAMIERGATSTTKSAPPSRRKVTL